MRFHHLSRPLRTCSRVDLQEAIFENTEEVICAITDDGYFAEINPACLDAWGYSQEELLYRSMISLVEPRFHALTMLKLQSARANSDTVRFENQVVRKDNSLVDTLWSVTWSAKQNVYICVTQDITERKQMEAEKEQYFSMISHDLRSPLSAVNFYLQTIAIGQYGQLPPKLLEMGRLAEGNLERTFKLIESVLNLQQFDSGIFELERSRTSVSEAMNEAHDALLQTAEMKGITIEVLPCDLYIDADHERIVQVLINLVANAITFSPGNSKVTMSASPGGDTVVLSVKDEGCGVPADRKAAIFQKFKQFGPQGERRYQGVGLGLAVCKAIVEAHSGTIGVESELGYGSRFWFSIPAASSLAPGEDSALWFGVALDQLDWGLFTDGLPTQTCIAESQEFNIGNVA